MSKFSNVDENAFNQRDRTPSRRGAGQTLVPDNELKASIDRARNSGEEKPFADMFIDHKWDAENCLPGQRRYRNRMARLGQGLNQVGDVAPDEY